jgi:hypothetical protein
MAFYNLGHRRSWPQVGRTIPADIAEDVRPVRAERHGTRHSRRCVVIRPATDFPRRQPRELEVDRSPSPRTGGRNACTAATDAAAKNG